MCSVQSGHIPFSCGCLSPTLVHLCNLFLVNTPVAGMLLTPRWVSRRKDVKELEVSIPSTAEQRFLLRRQPIFLSLHLDMVRIELNSHMPLQGPKCCIPLDPTCCLFVACCHDLRNRNMISEIGNHRFIDGFVLPAEREL